MALRQESHQIDALKDSAFVECRQKWDKKSSNYSHYEQNTSIHRVLQITIELNHQNTFISLLTRSEIWIHNVKLFSVIFVHIFPLDPFVLLLGVVHYASLNYIMSILFSFWLYNICFILIFVSFDTISMPVFC